MTTKLVHGFILAVLSISTNVWMCDMKSTENIPCSKDQYARYLATFSKELRHGDDHARLEQFCNAFIYINKYNTDPSSGIQLDLNEKSDLLDVELKALFSVVRDPVRLQGKQTFDISALRTRTVAAAATAEVMSELNWATTVNPRGFSVVSSVQNQGICGACWAFSATASVEAALKLSITGNSMAAISASATAKTTPGGDSNITTTTSAVEIPRLSVQQLIDCDRSFNLGCNGGSPYYALQYIAANGIVSADSYTFLEKQQAVCRSFPSTDNRYFVSRYALLPTNNENSLMVALNSGPIIIGICGTDLPFLYYSSGVYNIGSCCTTQNHAMLLVGYGHDDASGLDYWIAQNSWGTAWGEKGYMRILRQTGTTAAFNGGICGMTLGPVVSSGGYIQGNGTAVSGGTKTGQGGFVDRYVLWPMVILWSWTQQHWREAAFYIACISLSLGVVFLCSGLYLDRLLRLRIRARAERRGYVSVPDSVVGGASAVRPVGAEMEQRTDGKSNSAVGGLAGTGAVTEMVNFNV